MAKSNHQAMSFWSIHIVLVFLFLLLNHCSCDDSYNTFKTLLDEKLGKSRYSPELRPIWNQSRPINCYFSFILNSLVEVNDVEQKFTIDGMMDILWIDELISWNPKDYGEVTYVGLDTTSLWKPRMFQVNTLGERDPFGDDHYPFYLYSSGYVYWLPGGMFTTTCALDMEKYPFDVQVCELQLCPMKHLVDQMTTVIRNPQVVLDYYVTNEGWELLDATVEKRDTLFNKSVVMMSCPTMKFTIKRRPYFFVLNIILPVIVLSLLNILVFLIPIDSGEKISYGITVLLALSLCLSIVGSMLPRASTKIPAVTFYLFSQLLMSAVSVVITILISCQQKPNEPQEHRMYEISKLMKEVTDPNEVVEDWRIMNHFCSSSVDTDESKNVGRETWGPKKICQHLAQNVNKVCFTVFLLLWVFTTLAYFIHVVE